MTWKPFRFVRKPARRRPITRARLALEELESRLTPSVNVLTYHNDTGNTGQNLGETSLTPTNVNSSSFGKLFSTTVDGQVYAQPLVMTGVNITAGTQQGTHDVVLVATEHDSLYAIDANTGSVLWHDVLLPSKYGGTVTTVPSGDVNSGDLTPEIGITATPVIDPSTNTIYLEEKTKEVTGGNNHYLHWLQALDVGSGAAKLGGPVLIADSSGDTYVSGPTVNGSGANPSGAPAGKVAFDALRQMARPGLTLANGNVYLAYASHGDNGPYHGWALGYSASTLAATAVFNTTPNGSNGGIWQSGTALAVDSSGNLYLETGNGTFETTLNSSGFPVNGDFGDSFVKLAVDTSSSASNQNGNLNGWGLKAADYFTPFNQANLNNGDVDLGSGGPFLLPDSAGSAAHPHLMVGSGKEGRIYLIDRDNMGHFSSTTDHVVQELPAVTISGSFGTGAYFNGQIYYVGGSNIGNPNDVAKTFSITAAQLSTSPTSSGHDTFGFPGNSPSISANGSANGILWAVDKGSNQLRAYNAANLATELYTSAQAPNNSDALGSAIKFAVPTVANSHVYVGTSNALVVYGLRTQATQPPAAPTNLTATTASSTVIDLAWTDNDTPPNSATGYDIEDSTDGTTFVQVATASAGATSFAAGSLQPSTTYTFRVRAFNNIGNSAYTNTATATTLANTGGLAAPSTLTATAATGTQINLTWTNNATNQTGFHIDRANDSAFTLNLVTQTAAASATTFSDSGLTPGTTYFYRVRAFNSTGDSANSNTASATTLTLPAAPTNFHPTLVTPTGVDLEWVNNATNATSVKVFRALGTNSPVTAAVLSSQVNSFFDTGLTPGAQYTYSIQSFNNAGPSSLQTFIVITPATAASGFSAHINFSNNQTQVPAGYINDTGAPYGPHGSLTYGWLANGTPTDNSTNARDRDSAISPDELHDSLIHLQKPNNPNAAWQIAVPNGTYEVHILSGDPTATDSVYSLNADGVNVVTATPNSRNLWADGTQTITVTNGLITVTSGAGASNNKIDAIDILPVTPGTQVLAIDAGGAAVGSFAADEDFSGGAARSTTATITTSGASNPAPATVYQSQRFGNFTYTLPNLTAGTAYTVRLHFAEFVQNGPGLRTFSVTINGTPVLSNFDVFQAAGGFEKALTETFTTNADSSGKITIVFTNGNNNAIVNGIEVLSNGVNLANFAGAAGLALNGSAMINGNDLQLTDGGMTEAGSAFTIVPVSVAQFTNSFSFQLVNPNADGFTFALQGVSPTALGGTGGGLGYAPDPGTGIGGAIGKSVAIKFDLFNNAGEGVDSTGLYTNGAEPTVPATDLTGTGIDLHSGHVFNVGMNYNGTTLTLTITDATTGAAATQSYTVNIPQTLGSSLAYIGFTAGTGGQTSTDDILSWDYTPLA
jgi:hypothetical protein